MCWELCGSCEQAGPEQVMVISGGCCCAQEQKRYIIGNCAWAWCWCTQVQWLNLGIMTILPAVTPCETSKGVPVSVTGFAQVKVMTGNDDSILHMKNFSVGLNMKSKDLFWEFWKTIFVQSVQ